MNPRRTTGRNLRPTTLSRRQRQRARLGPITRRRTPRNEPPIATGQDFLAPEPRRERRAFARSAWLAIAVGGLGAALVLVQLRTESIGLRYRLGRAQQSEQQLLERQSRFIVEQRQLRHPVRLAELGRSLGLARPEAVRELAAPGAPGGGAP